MHTWCCGAWGWKVPELLELEGVGREVPRVAPPGLMESREKERDTPHAMTHLTFLTSTEEMTQTCTKGKAGGSKSSSAHPDPAVCLQLCPKPDAFVEDARSCLNKRLCNPSAEEMSFPIPSH